MFLKNLNTQEEQFLFIKLALCVALADEVEPEDKILEFLAHCFSKDLKEYNPFSHKQKNPKEDFSFIKKKFFNSFGIKNIEVELIYSIIFCFMLEAEIRINISRLNDSYEKKLCELIYKFCNELEEITDFFTKTLYQELSLQNFFPPIIKKIFNNSNLSLTAKKIMFIELTNIAFANKEYSTSKLFILRKH